MLVTSDEYERGGDLNHAVFPYRILILINLDSRVWLFKFGGIFLKSEATLLTENFLKLCWFFSSVAWVTVIAAAVAFDKRSEVKLKSEDHWSRGQ